MATKQEIKDLQQEIRKIKTLGEDYIEKLAEDVQEGSSSRKGELRLVANQVGKNVRSFFSEKQKQLTEAKSTCESTIKRKPFMSIAAAFASGALIAFLIKRKP